MAFKITLLGFEDYQEKLFVQQLKTVRKHTSTAWCVNETNQPSNYIIEYLVATNKAFVYRTADPKNKKEMDWPVRLFCLLDILKEYEKNHTQLKAEPINDEFMSTDTVYKFDSWPSLNALNSTPGLLRLAALFTQKYVSIAQAVSFSKLTESDVIGFLNLCEQSGVIIEKQVIAQQEKAQAKELSHHAHNSLLSKLRSKLGLVFSR